MSPGSLVQVKYARGTRAVILTPIQALLPHYAAQRSVSDDDYSEASNLRFC